LFGSVFIYFGIRVGIGNRAGIWSGSVEPIDEDLDYPDDLRSNIEFYNGKHI